MLESNSSSLALFNKLGFQETQRVPVFKEVRCFCCIICALMSMSACSNRLICPPVVSPVPSSPPGAQALPAPPLMSGHPLPIYVDAPFHVLALTLHPHAQVHLELRAEPGTQAHAQLAQQEFEVSSLCSFLA